MSVLHGITSEAVYESRLSSSVWVSDNLEEYLCQHLYVIEAIDSTTSASEDTLLSLLSFAEAASVWPITVFHSALRFKIPSYHIILYL